jgi:hypothetical protein
VEISTQNIGYITQPKTCPDTLKCEELYRYGVDFRCIREAEIHWTNGEPNILGINCQYLRETWTAKKERKKSFSYIATSIPMKDVSLDVALEIGQMQNHLQIAEEAYKCSPEYRERLRYLNILALRILINTEYNLDELMLMPLYQIENWMRKLFLLEDNKT